MAVRRRRAEADGRRERIRGAAIRLGKREEADMMFGRLCVKSTGGGLRPMKVRPTGRDRNLSSPSLPPFGPPSAPHHVHNHISPTQLTTSKSHPLYLHKSSPTPPLPCCPDPSSALSAPRPRFSARTAPSTSRPPSSAQHPPHPPPPPPTAHPSPVPARPSSLLPSSASLRLCRRRRKRWTSTSPSRRSTATSDDRPSRTSRERSIPRRVRSEGRRRTR